MTNENFCDKKRYKDFGFQGYHCTVCSDCKYSGSAGRFDESLGFKSAKTESSECEHSDEFFYDGKTVNLANANYNGECGEAETNRTEDFSQYSTNFVVPMDKYECKVTHDSVDEISQITESTEQFSSQSNYDEEREMGKGRNVGENIGEEYFKTESGKGENTDGKMIRKKASKTEEEFEVCCSTDAEGENKDWISEGCKFISYYSPCYPSLMKKAVGHLNSRSSKQNIIAGKMLFAFVLLLCFNGIVAYNSGTSWRNNNAFAALKTDGSVVAWGNATYGGNAPSGLTNVQTIYSTGTAFAALNTDGSVVAWGAAGGASGATDYGGTAPSGLTNVQTIYSTESAFAALKTDGSVVAWGDSNSGGTAPNGLTNVQTIYSTYGAFAALKTDGSVVAWENYRYGGTAPSSGLTNVQTIYSTGYAFAALKTDGSVVAWGSVDFTDGDISAPSGLTNVQTIYSTGYAFAALKTDGSVVAWGGFTSGGTVPSGLTNIQTIYSGLSAFAALKTDGSVVAWGFSPGSQKPSGLTNVQTIYSTGSAFAALKTDSSVVVWGAGGYGGNAPSGLTNVKVVYGNTFYRSFSTEPHSYIACEYEYGTYSNGDFCESYPTSVPTLQPTQPTGQPTSQPSVPTSQPSSQPSGEPTTHPSGEPSGQPSAQPSALPSGQPSALPSGQPSALPSALPSGQPSALPSGQPSALPTASPSFEGTRTIEFPVPYLVSFPHFSATAKITGVKSINGEKTYLSVFLWRITWNSNNYLQMKMNYLDATWEKYCSPPQHKICGEDTSDENYDNCWSNIDVTNFIHPEHGGSLYLELTSNLGSQVKSECQKDSTSVYTKFEISHRPVPTASPSHPPTIPLPPSYRNETIITKDDGSNLNFDINPKTWVFLAVILALFTLGLGLFFTFLRKGSKAVEIPIPKIGFIMFFIGAETMTTIVLLVDILKSKYEDWGFVIAVMRLMHTFVAIFILATIYGTKYLQDLTGLVVLLDRKHMGLNPKMYAVASICCVFDIKAFILLPWCDAEFTRQCFGTAPNMMMFRTVELTTIFTGLVTIVSQIPYVTGEPYKSTTIFFYANMAMASVKMMISLLAYCVSVGGLVECEAAKLKEEKDTDDIELADVIPNPISEEQQKEMREKEGKIRDEMQEQMQKQQQEMQKQQQEMQKQRQEMQEQMQKQQQEMQEQMQKQQQEMIQQMQSFKSLESRAK
eukprot:GSChrysophyteH2.ASY1.ANO1.1039.1 assembled CDS